MKATQLKAAYLSDPLGIDLLHPRLSWKCLGGEKQSAYEIKSSVDGKEGWRSGKVLLSSMHVEFLGELHSGARVLWKDRLILEKRENRHQLFRGCPEQLPSRIRLSEWRKENAFSGPPFFVNETTWLIFPTEKLFLDLLKVVGVVDYPARYTSCIQWTAVVRCSNGGARDRA
ncbi:MAG: hypothetical protein LKE31_01420 [Bacilli bacterium]|jgi:hypothetical protein|nr:hypothetical protein [Bacilli bacterium]